MIAPPRPALAALEAGAAHVARHHRRSLLVAAGPRERLVALHLALNILKELDTLLGHAVIETAAIAGVILPAPASIPVRRALAELIAALGPGIGSCAGLAEAEWAREGLVRALAGASTTRDYRLPAAYPDRIGATYRRIARDLGRAAESAAAVAASGRTAAIAPRSPVASSLGDPDR